MHYYADFLYMAKVIHQACKRYALQNGQDFKCVDRSQQLLIAFGLIEG